jgi:hypothetical protein
MRTTMSTHQKVRRLQVEEMEKRMAPMSLACPSFSLAVDPVVIDPPECTEPPEGRKPQEKPIRTYD